METQTSNANVDIVSINIVTPNKVITIGVICTLVICGPLSNQNVRKVSNNYVYLKNIKLADSSDKKIKDTEILIGLDYYYQIVIGKIIRGNNK